MIDGIKNELKGQLQIIIRLTHGILFTIAALMIRSFF